jgi:hypothetical protein
MKMNQLSASPKKAMLLNDSTATTWALFSFWLIYSALMLWHFKELSHFKAALCSVIR